MKRNIKNFPLKMVLYVKKKIGVILDPKMMASLNSGCNISIRVSVHLCKFVSRVIRNIPDASFTFTEGRLGKMLLPSEAILHGLACISIGSSFFSRDFISSLKEH